MVYLKADTYLTTLKEEIYREMKALDTSSESTLMTKLSPNSRVIATYGSTGWADATTAIISRAKESENPTAVVLQHEYGLDPSDDGRDGCGDNYVKIAKECTENGMTTIVYLHTVIENPNDHQKKTIQDLFSDSRLDPPDRNDNP